MHGQKPKLPIKTVFMGVLALIAVFFVITVGDSTVEHVDRTDVMVIQSLTGNLSWYMDGGYHVQALGTVTKYPKRSQYWFTHQTDQGTGADQSIKVRFNDGGHALVSGSIAWEMPSDEMSLNSIHTKYGNPRNLEQQLIRTIVEKAVYMTGPLMSSKESYAERRNELIRFIEDQIENGVYQTETETVKEIDPMTGVEKTVGYVRLVRDESGTPLRQEESPLAEFKIRTFNLSINQVAYDQKVEQQISAQQDATMQVQTAIAKAKEAEQAAITAAKHGEAEAAKAKWEQEVIKAKMVTQAEQQLEVARLEKEAAAQEKAKEILLGEGVAARRRLEMQADGALDKKLAAWVKVNEAYATAIQNIQQPLVPVVQSGDNGKGGQTAVQDLIQIIMAQTAKDLAVRPTPSK